MPASLSVLASLVAAARLAPTMLTYAADNRQAFVFVWLLPIALAVLGLHASWRGSLERIWLSAALLASALLINNLIVPAAVLMLLAAILLSLGQPSWWILTVPLWIVAGIAALPTGFLLFLRSDHPFNILGLWVFLGTALALAACHVGRHIWKQQRRVWWAPLGVAAFLLLEGFVVGHMIGAWQNFILPARTSTITNSSGFESLAADRAHARHVAPQHLVGY